MRRVQHRSHGNAPPRSAAIQIRKVMRLEKAVWKAALERDARKFAKLVPADALMIFRSGIMTQPEYLATMRGRSLEKNRIKELRGFMPDSKMVILTYKTVRAGSYEGKAFPSAPVIESTTWIRRGKRWLAILNQETPIDE